MATKRIVFPDYSRCILNTVGSVLRHYGAASPHAPLSALEGPLSRRPRSVVLMVLDGLGADALERNLPPDAFLRKHIAQNVTTVYPSTTTAATTAYYSGLTPAQHGWLGWTLYFKEYGGIIEAYPNRFAYTGQSAGEESAAFSMLPYTTIFSAIDGATGGMPIHLVTPAGIGFPENPATCAHVQTFAALCEEVGRAAGEAGEERLIVAYWPEPDSTMHEYGCASPEAAARIGEINALIEGMCEGVEDTLLLISADHGQTDMAGYISLEDAPELDECLLMPPSLESRAASLFLRPGKTEVFLRRFAERCGEDFLLLPREEVLERGLFGPGEPHRMVDAFLGDFLACAIGDVGLLYRGRNGPVSHMWKGHHAGLTEAEMVVPVIVVER